MGPIMPFLSRLGLALIGLVMTLSCSAAVADLVAVVSARSPVNALSRTEIADIFLGKTALLPGGEPAVPIDQAEGSPVRNEFYAKFAGKSPSQIKAHWAKLIFTGRGQPPREESNSFEVKRRVIHNPNAIGYMEKDMVDDSVRVLQSQ